MLKRGWVTKYVGGSTGFQPDFAIAISCVAIQRSALILTAVLRFPSDQVPRETELALAPN